MENASKALIIAGAILISIVLIGVGVLVVSGAQGTIDESILQMSQQQIQMFNKTYEAYCNSSQTGANIKALISAVNTNNLNASADQIEGRTIVVSLDGEEASESADLVTLSSKVNTGARYSVVPNFNQTTKLIDKLTITKNVVTK